MKVVFLRPFKIPDIKSIFKAYSQLFFLKDTKAGILISLLTFSSFNIGLCGIISLSTIILLSHFLGSEEDFSAEGYLLYNPLMVGLGIGYLFKFNAMLLLIIMASSLSCYFISILFRSILSKYFLMVMSLPYCLIMIFFFLAAKNYSNLYYMTLPTSIWDQILPIPLVGLSDFPYVLNFLKALGSIIYNPHPVVGAIIFVMILYYSRTLPFIMILGFILSGFFENSLYHLEWKYNTLPYSFNYLLISAGLCSIFMLPTLKSLIILPLALISTLLLKDALVALFAPYQIPIFTLPYNLVTLVFVYGIGFLKIKNFPIYYGKTPEESLDNTLLFEKQNRNKISIGLPLEGLSFVYQSFSGPWTHQGKWKYALDLIKLDESGKSFQGKGLHKEDYYCFGAKVLSPIDGTVANLRLNLPDNDIGLTDTFNNWGNYIILYSTSGFYVQVNHLQQFSSGLVVGAQVRRGEVIALAGNSGYSPEPHVHLQVQLTPVVGDTTWDFTIDQYQVGQELKLASVPAQGLKLWNPNNTINATRLNHDLESKMTYQLDFKLPHRLAHNSHSSKTLQLVVKLDRLWGSFFWEDQFGNRAYTARGNSSFYFSHYSGHTRSPLGLFLVFLPRLPYYYQKGLVWEEAIPNILALSAWQRFFYGLLSYFLPQLPVRKTIMKYLDFGLIAVETHWQGKKLTGTIQFSDAGHIESIDCSHFSLKLTRWSAK